MLGLYKNNVLRLELVQNQTYLMASKSH